MKNPIKSIPPFGSVQLEEWEVVYSIRKSGLQYIGEVEHSYLPLPYIFTANSLIQLNECIQLWLKEIIQTKEVYTLYKEGYSIYLIQDSLFLSYPDIPYGYLLIQSEKDTHTNRLSAMKMPSFLESKEAQYYCMLSTTQEILRDKELVSSFSLYSVRINPKECFLSSDSIRNMDLFTKNTEIVSEKYFNNLIPLQNIKELPILTQMAKENFNMNDLILSYQPSEADFKLLGSWDTEGKFSPTSDVYPFLLSKFKDSSSFFL